MKNETLPLKIIGGLITIILAFIAWQSSNWSTSIQELSNTVGQLNVKMEVVVNEIGTSKENYKDHEMRLRSLEEKNREE
jgi:hypothetical protein